MSESVSPSLDSTEVSPFSGDCLSNFKFEDVDDYMKYLYVDVADNHGFKLRGASYMKDNVKQLAGTPILKLMHFEVYEVDVSIDGDRHDHIARRAGVRRRIAALRNVSPFILVLNFQIPGDPPVSLVSYFALPPEYAALVGVTIPEGCPEQSTPSGEPPMPMPKDDAQAAALLKCLSLMRRYIDLPDESQRADLWARHEVSKSSAPVSWSDYMPTDVTWVGGESAGVLPDTSFQNMRFKLIPNVVEGPYVVTAAVRPQPVLLGKKVVQRYFSGDGYLESDTHVGSSVIAARIVGVCRGYTRNFSTNVALVLQGESEDELPEMLLAVIQLREIDVDLRYKLDHPTMELSDSSTYSTSDTKPSSVADIKTSEKKAATDGAAESTQRAADKGGGSWW